MPKTDRTRIGDMPAPAALQAPGRAGAIAQDCPGSDQRC